MTTPFSPDRTIDAQAIRQSIRRVFSDAPFGARLLLDGRPYICPFDHLLKLVPTGARVLDVGCGSGLFLNLLADLGKLNSGVGFDANARAVDIAKLGAARQNSGIDLTFLHLPVEADWPEGEFEVVSMIDVIHHIDPEGQKQAVETALSHVKPGGLFLYKDMVARPAWRAWANRLHDLLLARQWINYVESGDVKNWVEESGFRLETRERTDMLWYGHETLLFRRGL